MNKKRRGSKVPLTQPVSYSKTKRTINRRVSKFANMTKEDLKETNKVSKRGRGLSGLSFKQIFGDDK